MTSTIPGSSSTPRMLDGRGRLFWRGLKPASCSSRDRGAGQDRLRALEGLFQPDPVARDVELAQRAVVAAVSHLEHREQPVEVRAQLDEPKIDQVLGERRDAGDR